MNTFRKGIAGGIPIALGYFAVSFSFGILAVKGGIHPLTAALISLTNVTSAGQFAGLTIILASGSLWEMALTQFIINLRYSLMSLSISQKLDAKLPLWHRFLMAFGMTDEIFGISAVQKNPLAPSFMYGAMAVAIPGWVLGTLVGGLAGSILPAFLLSALGVALYGMFIAIIIPPAKADPAVLAVVLLSMGCSCLFYFLPLLKQVSSGFVIIIVTVVVAGLMAWLKPVEEDPSDV